MISVFFAILQTFYHLPVYLKKYVLQKLRIPSVSNSFDPDKAKHLIWPDLSTNCLQSLPAEDKKDTTS